MLSVFVGCFGKHSVGVCYLEGCELGIIVEFCLFNSSCGGELLNMYMQFEYSLFVDMISAREVLLLS